MVNRRLTLYGGWTLKSLLGIVFLFAGASKLAGAPPMVQVFSDLGVGQWLRYVTAVIEITGAIALFVPGKAVYGALLLSCLMLSAVFTHLFLIDGSAVPAGILLGIGLSIAWLHKDQLRSFF